DMKLPKVKEARMTEEEISQAERRRILAEDRRRSTYHAHANDVEVEMGGRFAKLRTTQVTGSGAVVAYPKLPNGPWGEGPQVGDEPPLGCDVNAVEPVGEVHERKSSPVASVPRLRRRI